jgi:hypothetical protein
MPVVSSGVLNLSPAVSISSAQNGSLPTARNARGDGGSDKPARCGESRTRHAAKDKVSAASEQPTNVHLN